MRSEEPEEAAVQKTSSVRSACAAGGFTLGNFVSNRREFLLTVPQEERAQDVRTLDLTTDHPSVERALGVQWAVESDMLTNRSHEEASCPPCSVYNSLGIAALFLLIEKKILKISVE